jgi:hypothetical protein
LKHADNYLKHYADGREAKAGIPLGSTFTTKSASLGAAKPDADGDPAWRRRRIGWRGDRPPPLRLTQPLANSAHSKSMAA